MEGMLAEVRMFAGNFAPRSWAFCEGQLLAISQNSALFSLLGTIYGGDGRTTFALPDTRGRVVIGPGNGPGLSNRREGQKGGTETVTLSITQIPAHGHTIPPEKVQGSVTVGVNENGQDSSNPTTGVLTETAIYNSGAADNRYGHVSHDLNTVGGNTGNSGGGQGHENMQPWISFYYIICVAGVFPSRN